MFVLDTETVGIDGADAMVEPVNAPSNYKDPEKIAAFIEDATRKRIEKAGLYPYTARIVALGLQHQDASEPAVWIAQNEAQEADLLRKFWQTVYQPLSGHVETLITFNGSKFDLPLVVVRSRLLGVPCPDLNLDRYRSPHLDLLKLLTFDGLLDTRSLKWFAARFGLPCLDPLTGADVAGLVAGEDWAAIAAHNASDTKLTHALAQRLGVIARRAA